jgi:hypothetical protein
MSEQDFLGMLDDLDGPDNPPESTGPDYPYVPDEQAEQAEAADVVREQCAMWVEAVSAMRRGALWPGPSASPAEVDSALVQARTRLDRAEFLLGQAMSLKAGTAAQAKVLEAAADDAWDDQASAARHGPRREYEGPRERYAYWEIAIRPQRHQARQARALADYCKDCYDRIRLSYDGLNDLRRDLLGRLTHLRWESHLEQ